MQNQPIEEQVDAWATDYMAPWPELLEKQQLDYADEGDDWRRVAAEYVFPDLVERFDAMERAHDILKQEGVRIAQRAQEALHFDADFVLVVHVGIGCGAGWVDRYGGKPAVLFGVENIAQEGWDKHEALTGLIAHEIGHLAHFHWLEVAGRLTAGFVLDMRAHPDIGRFLLFFHGTPKEATTARETHGEASLALAWSRDLVHWEWPGPA